MQEAHENEIEMIKRAFEKELRKAEKCLKETAKKEENKLRQSLKEVEEGIYSVTKEKEQAEQSLHMQLSYSQSEVSKLKVDNEQMERFYEDELNKIREVARQEITNLKSQILKLEDEVDDYQ
mmetsp:Transcript_12541/g.12334  ORF Transcript_12541/g.12334 Transcript_12541/m.12334 type:complete len:122 (-) Transcript_12541:292-657(-)